MPCNSIVTQSVSLKNANPDVLTNALKADGWRVIETSAGSILAYRAGENVLWEKGKGVGTSGGIETVEEVTRAYSREAVTWAAKRAGWKVKQTGENKMVVSRG